MTTTTYKPIEATIIDPEYRFTATVDFPDGRRIEVTATIPERIQYAKDDGALLEVAELVGMGAQAVMRNLRRRDSEVTS